MPFLNKNIFLFFFFFPKKITPDTTTTPKSANFPSRPPVLTSSFTGTTDDNATKANDQPFIYTTIVPKCDVPRCKAYASVIRSECSTIVLKIRYPETQYGYNRTTHEWTTINCDTNIDGYKIWIIGQGVVRKFAQKGKIINSRIFSRYFVKTKQNILFCLD